MQSISTCREARIIDASKEGNTISGIAHQTGIPFTTVRRTIHAFEDAEIIKYEKIGKIVTVRINKNHPIIDSMINTARWINTIMWDPNTFVAKICEKKNIDYAFIGTSKIKYTKKESRNMIQIAILERDYDKAREIIHNRFKGMGIKTTDDSRKTIGNAMSTIYIKCFPVNEIKFDIYETKTSSGEIIKARIADDDTERKAMKNSTKIDKMFIPTSMYH